MIYNIYNMKKTTELVSQPIIRSMPKSNYQKALEYYGLAGKNSKQVASRFNFNPTYVIKRKNGTKDKKVVKPDNPNYDRRVEEYLIKKWKNDTQEYIGTYNMYFKKYDKTSKKMKDVAVKITARGTKDSILLDALAQYNTRKQRYEEDYPENDSYALDEEPVSLIPYTAGSGISVEKQRVESSVSGGQRVVGKRGVKRTMKMKRAYQFLKFAKDDNGNPCEWDRNEGTCVFDYLYWKFKDVKGFDKFFNGTKTKQKTREEVYDELNDLFKGTEIDEQNPLRDGVSVSQLESFCEEFKIAMYAWDKDDSLVEYYKPSKTGGRGVLIFNVFDNHFSPIDEIGRAHV